MVYFGKERDILKTPFTNLWIIDCLRSKIQYRVSCHHWWKKVQRKKYRASCHHWWIIYPYLNNFVQEFTYNLNRWLNATNVLFSTKPDPLINFTYLLTVFWRQLLNSILIVPPETGHTCRLSMCQIEGVNFWIGWIRFFSEGNVNAISVSILINLEYHGFGRKYTTRSPVLSSNEVLWIILPIIENGGKVSNILVH